MFKKRVKSHYKRHRWDWLSLSILALLALAFLWRVVLLGEVLLPADMIYTAEPWLSESSITFAEPLWNPEVSDSIWQHYPVATYAKEARQQGVFFWDPYPLTGMPALARGEYFSNPLYIVLSTFMSVAKAYSWMAAIILLFASTLTFLLLREMGINRFGALIGSLAFAYNGYLVGWLSHPHNISAMVWLPLIFWGIERALKRQDWRWTLISSLGFVLQTLSGFVLWLFYGSITLILFYSYRSVVIWFDQKDIKLAIRPLFYTGLVLGIGSLFAAPQLLITAQHFLLTPRSEPLGASSFLNIKSQLVRLIVPSIYGSNVRGDSYWGPFNYTETDLYFGVSALLFVIASFFCSKRKLAWGFLGIGAITIFAVYNIYPIRQLVSLIYPVFLNTFPGRIFYISAFTWSIAAGFGADWLVSDRPGNFLKYLSITTALLAVTMLIISTLSLCSKSSTLVLSELPAFLEKLARTNLRSFVIAFLFLMFSALLFWGWSINAISKKHFQGLCLVILVIDLFLNGINYNPTFDSEYVFPETPSLQFLSTLESKENQPYRVLNINSGLILLGMTPELYRFPTISGYSSWVLKRYSDYADLTQDRGRADPVHVYFNDCCHRLTNALNVKYVYSDPYTQPFSFGDLDLSNNLEHAHIETGTENSIFRTTWNLENVQSPVLFEHPPARVSYTLLIQNSSTLKTAISLDPTSWNETGDGVRFEIFAKIYGEDDEELLFSRYTNPKDNPSDRRWIPVSVDLSRFLGKEIELSLVTQPGPNGDNGYDHSGWKEPKIENYYSRTLELVYDGPNKVYKNLNALPRSWIVPLHSVIQEQEGDIEAVKKRLSAPKFNPSFEAIVESNDLPVNTIKSESNIKHPAEKVDIISYSPERVEIEAILEEPGLLVLSDMMYPGWKAFVDGVEKPILTTNLIMRGIILEEGKHLVEFEYIPQLFILGLWITSITILSVIIGLVLSRKSTRNKN